MIRLAGLSSLIAFFLTVSLAQGQPDKRPMTVDDQLNMVGVGTGLISPAGDWVLFSKSELDWKKNKRESSYYRVDADGENAYRFIGKEGGSQFQFSPKGTYLSFLRSVADDGEKDKKSQIFLIRASGGEAIQQTKHATSIRSYKWTEDETRIFFVADQATTKEEKKEKKDGYDAVWVDEGPNGQRSGAWRHLWMYDLEKQSESAVMEDDVMVGGFDVSADGERVVYTARLDNRRNQQYLTEIYLINVKDKLKTRLTDNRVPEGNVVWAPDGQRFAYIANDDKEWELRNGKIWVMDADTRTYKNIFDSFEGSVRGFYWTPDSKKILFTGLQRTDSNLYEIDVDSGSVQQLTHHKGSLGIRSFSQDRSRYVYTFSDFDTPSDLWIGSRDGSDPIRLTNANPWVEKDLLLAEGRVIGWKSTDGTAIEGLLHLPGGYREGTRIPLMLNIHGGPAGVFTNSFSPRYHIYAGLGYASLSPNVRGSSGYSDALLRGNIQDIGGGDYQDLMTGVDHVIREGYADSERMGLRGWSYGGILGGWTITQTDRFKAASVGAMVSDWTSEYGPGFNHDVRLWYIGGTPWENPEGWRQKSALTHVANITTPTIILHGDNDRTDTEQQSMMFFAAIKDQGKEVRYIRFPREPHGFREPRHQRTRDVEEIRWMQKYVLGEEWAPWERESDQEDKKDTPVDKAKIVDVSSGN